MVSQKTHKVNPIYRFGSENGWDSDTCVMFVKQHTGSIWVEI